ncbi:uncharacterized protein LOC122067357 isoform X2 [Macadamia integrifolia]|uniref:uncharacterized protein LOC122067357 isoform X2 n=1 Tax=Macadamia integrifolia TaxID=60698 RepID=UPI001C4EBBE5|nr:uncharacterized protein LOC122067357 isoform X2 [Macadamia integrifolia]
MASAIKMEDEGEDGTTEEEEFNLKQQVWMYERQAVLSMYTPPSANQSWRKALSMGNHLKGHKAVVREIIFSMQDSMTHDHQGIAGAPTRILKHIECTYVEHPIIFWI